MRIYFGAAVKNPLTDPKPIININMIETSFCCRENLKASLKMKKPSAAQGTIIVNTPFSMFSENARAIPAIAPEKMALLHVPSRTLTSSSS